MSDIFLINTEGGVSISFFRVRSVPFFCVSSFVCDFVFCSFFSHGVNTKLGQLIYMSFLSKVISISQKLIEHIES